MEVLGLLGAQQVTLAYELAIPALAAQWWGALTAGPHYQVQNQLALFCYQDGQNLVRIING